MPDGKGKSEGTDEKGREYSTPVVEVMRCRECGGELPVHKEGRTPLYCGPTCRQRAYRATRLF